LAIDRAIKAAFACSKVYALTRQQDWDLDSIGNWTADQYDIDGDGFYTSPGDVNVASTFNAANEQTARTPVGGAAVNPVFDAVGNLTNDKTYRYTYDVWGRVVKVRAAGVNFIFALYRYKWGGVLWYRMGYSAAAEPRCQPEHRHVQLERGSVAVLHL